MRVRISDQGGGKPIKNDSAPDLDAKLAGEQSPRGWGLFLIKNMVDEMNVYQDENQHTIELLMLLEVENQASRTALRGDWNEYTGAAISG